MRDGAEDARPHRPRERDAALAHAGSIASHSPSPSALDVDLHEVRLHALEVDRHALRGPGLARAAARARDPRRAARRCGRAHRCPAAATIPAWRIAPPKRCFSTPRAVHQLVRAGDQRAERAAEALREAERDGVERRRRSRAAGTPDATAAFSSRAPSRCSFSPSSRAVATTLAQLVERPDGAAGVVVRVLERDDRRARRVEAAVLVHRRADLLRREAAAVRRAARASAGRRASRRRRAPRP